MSRSFTRVAEKGASFGVNTTLLTVASFLLIACTGGAGDSGGSPNAEFKLSPDTLTLTSGESATINLIGGRRPFSLVTASNSALTVVDDLQNGRVQITAGLIAADATVAVIVRDASNAQASSTVSVKPGAFSVLPTEINVNGDSAAELLVRGGRAPFQVTTDSPGLITILSGAETGKIAFFANQVSTETTAKIIVRDAVGLEVSGSIRVKPSALTREISLDVLPSPGAEGAVARCPDGGTVCAGGFARVTVKVSGLVGAVVNRPMRFEVKQGAFQFATDPTLTQFAANAIASTDGGGLAIASLRAESGAATQPAVLQVTDLLSNDVRVFAFTIGGRALSLIPNKVTFAGARAGVCGGGTADVAVFGGAPPYDITVPIGFSVTPARVVRGGDRFRVTTGGMTSCATTQSFQIPVSDAQGVVIPLTIDVSQGTQTDPAPAVAPSSLTVNSCSGSASAVYTGTINTFAAPREVNVTVGGNTVTVRPALGATNGTYVVAFTNGTASASLSVTFANLPATGCP
jgi:hypothetical protein